MGNDKSVAFLHFIALAMADGVEIPFKHVEPFLDLPEIKLAFKGIFNNERIYVFEGEGLADPVYFGKGHYDRIVIVELDTTGQRFYDTNGTIGELYVGRRGSIWHRYGHKEIKLLADFENKMYRDQFIGFKNGEFAPEMDMVKEPLKD